MIDSEPLQHVAFNRYLGPKFGFTLSDADFTEMVGIHELENWRQLCAAHHITEDVDVLSRERNLVYLEILRKNVRPMQGLLDLVDRCRSFGLKLAVASSSSMEQIQIVVSGLCLNDAFAALASGYEVARSKPDPALALLAARRLDVSPASCLVLEDSAPGLEAARAAGMRRIGVPNAYTLHQDLSDAEMIVDSLEDVTVSTLRRFGLLPD